MGFLRKNRMLRPELLLKLRNDARTDIFQILRNWNNSKKKYHLG